MIVWLRIESAPVREFYGVPEARPMLAGDGAQHALLLGLSPIRSSATGESANVTAAVRNGSGEASAILAARPPLGAVARVMSESGELLAGTVRAVNLSADGASIEIEP